MPTCSADHASSTDAYCRLCGAPIGTPSSAPERRPNDSDPSSRTELLVRPAAGLLPDHCPACSGPRASDDRFCERCGHKFDVADALAGSWVAEVSADRAYYERIVPRRIVPRDRPFPVGRQLSVLPLGPGGVTIGRRGDPTGPLPDVDLSGPLDDPYVSRRHARIVRRAGRDHQVIDIGSKNGTRVNDEMARLDPGTPRRLSDGDRIHVGAWTTITLRFRPRA